MDASGFVPEAAGIAELASAVQGCRGCELYRGATQAVLGDGSPNARVVLVGEQPGDQEDRKGEPFVGPAGRLLDRALADAGLARDDCYLTNAVKHFRFERGETRPRLHKKPAVRHITACRPWLAAELAAVAPEVVVALGATAVRAVAGTAYRVGADRGRLLPPPDDTGPRLVISTHPSAVLRAPGGDARHEAYQGLVRDLAVAAAAVRR